MGDESSNNVQWYFGNSEQAAILDVNALNGNYSKGAVKDPQLPLAFGNFGSGFKVSGGLCMRLVATLPL